MKKDRNRLIGIDRFCFFLIAMVLNVLINSNSVAQEYFQLNQFIYSAHAINPAFSGIEDLVSVNLGLRAQWASINEAPRTYYFAFNGSLSGMKHAFSNQRTLRKSVPRLYNKLEYEPGNISHGFGFYLFQDAFGPFRETAGYLTYALKYQLNKNYKISFGLSTDISNQRFRENEVSVYNPDLDIIYQKYAAGPGNITDLNLNTGVLLYGKDLFFSYALHQFLNVRISKDNFTEAGSNGLFHFFMAGVNIPLSPEFLLQPSTFVKYSGEGQTTVDLIGKIKYREIFWTGLSYRHQDAAGFLLGFLIEQKVYFNYSFEFHTNDIRSYSGGSHELVLGYRIFNDRLSRPFIW
jgi:type IX secretion system PorP/SprF family membrane protein